jgi:hypothetical protein
MPIEVLSIGMPWTMIANRIYALPPFNVVLFTDATTPTIQQSLTSAFTANVAVTLTGGQATLAGGWIRATADTPVILKKA